MICPEYSDLTIVEAYQLVGKAIHLLQNNSEAFKAISSMVRQAENNGEFDNVRILPETTTDEQSY